MAWLSTLSFILSHAFRACVTLMFVCVALIGVGSADHFISSSLRAAALRAHLANPKARPRGHCCRRFLVCSLFAGALAGFAALVLRAGHFQWTVERLANEPVRQPSTPALGDNDTARVLMGGIVPSATSEPPAENGAAAWETVFKTLSALLNMSFTSFIAACSECVSTVRWELLALITSCVVFLSSLLVQRCCRRRRKSAAVQLLRAKARQEPSTPLSSAMRARDVELSGSAATAMPVPVEAAPPAASTPATAPKSAEPVAMTPAFPFVPLSPDVESPSGVTLASMRARAADARAALRANQTAGLLSLIAEGVGLGSAQDLLSTGIPAARLGLSPPSAKSPTLSPQ